ncbi:hypothetical protein FOL47_011054 [Perkinsus chesapeaki]|uniref:Uncharacterized protein n=1 Tax=Perkinsus chesapeaki TaxID=330153 RepID=A0A7J6KZZ6_PERCH|nr:hypothetical protein FOL47_011054 [Perkinsus chesapeaki]
MTFSSTWLVFAAQALPSAVAQPTPGRYCHDNANKNVWIVFRNGETARQITEGSFPLIPWGGQTNTINFGDQKVLYDLYSSMRDIYPEIVFRDGDLKALTFLTGDTLYAVLGGRTLDMMREGLPIKNGMFVYMEGDYPSPSLHISYTVHENGHLDVQFICTDLATPVVSFTLAGNTSGEYLTYDLTPATNIDRLKHGIQLVCPGLPMDPGSLTAVTFAAPGVIFISLRGTRYALKRV